jgi:CheY-like chemotaxis protein
VERQFMKSILVVDDDSSVRELLTIVLGDQYAVSVPAMDWRLFS